MSDDITDVNLRLRAFLASSGGGKESIHDEAREKALIIYRIGLTNVETDSMEAADNNIRIFLQHILHISSTEKTDIHFFCLINVVDGENNQLLSTLTGLLLQFKTDYLTNIVAFSSPLAIDDGLGILLINSNHDLEGQFSTIASLSPDILRDFYQILFFTQATRGPLFTTIIKENAREIK